MELNFIKDFPSVLSSLPQIAAKTICCLVIGTVSVYPGIAASPMPPIQAQVTVEGGGNFSVGEPLSLLYKLTNVSGDQNVGVGLGADKAQWCQLSLTDASGRITQTILDDSSPEPRGLHFTGAYLLQPDASEQDYIVVTRYLRISQPGKYTLTVQVHLPYTLEEPSASASLVDRIKSSSKVLTTRFVFPLNVTAANTTNLAAEAANLSRRAKAEKDDSTRKFLLDELFSMPAAQAAPVWQELVLGASPMDRDLLVGKLAGLRSSEAANILLQMIDNPATNSRFISDRLAEIYNHGTPAVRAHIKSIAEHRGLQVPERIVLPQIMD